MRSSSDNQKCISYKEEETERERKVASSEVKPTEIGTKERKWEPNKLIFWETKEEEEEPNWFWCFLLTTTNKLEIKIIYLLFVSTPNLAATRHINNIYLGLLLRFQLPISYDRDQSYIQLQFDFWHIQPIN